MNCKEYLVEASKTFPEFSKKIGDNSSVLNLNAKEAAILNAIVGLVGEAAEIQDAYKKTVFQGHPFNEEDLKLELGDVFWYAALLCYGLDCSFEEIMEKNIQKLRKRYGDHFESSKSVNREEYLNR